MGSVEVVPEESMELLKDLLADFLAGGVDVVIGVVFHVQAPEDGECLSPEGVVCPVVADSGDTEEINVDGAAD